MAARLAPRSHCKLSLSACMTSRAGGERSQQGRAACLAVLVPSAPHDQEYYQLDYRLDA